MSPTHASARWSNLPADMHARVLVCLPLYVLCALKALSRATANTCRRVLRSEEWQTGINGFQLETALTGCPQQIQFPFTVSVLETYFGGRGYGYIENVRKGDKYLLATIHRLNILCLDNDSNRVEFHKALLLEDQDEIRYIIIDACIEIDGYGIVSSGQQLRTILQKVVMQRGVRRFPMQKGHSPDRIQISGLKERDCPDGNWSVTGDDTGYDVMETQRLLDNMKVVTEVAKDKWMHHGIPDCGAGYTLTVFDLMRWNLGPFRL